ncbi:MAG: ABC transporter ATP-binding protein [Candidatus Riflebacteria bacterium]|nr:ABC transporter ATP-binding protein [Candidatus Riflebacteria bacterium]
MNVVEVRGLRYRYQEGNEALQDVSLALAEGERLGLIGPNGAGKSTLLWHLNGLLPENPTGPAAVHVLGTPVEEPFLAEVRTRVGLLFQNPDDQLFCPTVGEDVAFGPMQLGLQEAEWRERVRSSLARVGLAGFENRHPHHLSQGEKHRVCLAGLLAMDSRVLVLDEPSAGLDPRGRRELKELLLGLPLAQIMATHDLELVVEVCHRVLVLDAGRVVAQGPVPEILGDESLMLAHGLETPHILRHRHPHG